MSKSFIEEKIGTSSIIEASNQQDRINYFTKSTTQADISYEYIKSWAQRKYRTDDYFLNFVKTIFRTENFLSFFKYYRNPNASSKLINNRVLNPLSRVFHSEDSYKEYTIRTKKVEDPEELNDDFAKNLFNSLLFNHNAILVHDLAETNTPFRFFLDIDKVVSIKTNGDDIARLAFSAKAMIEGEEVVGFSYIDDMSYQFYDQEYNLKLEVPHDLGKCPAVFVSPEAFDDDPIVRKSIFTYVREELEEYTFLKTLQRMTEPNGAIPTVTQLDAKTKKAGGDDSKRATNEPMSAKSINGQQSEEFHSQYPKTDSLLQTGTVVKVPMAPLKKQDGSYDMDVVKNLINFNYLPVGSLEYLSKRIKEVEQSIITSLLGDYSEANEEAKNELQVSKSYVSKEDVLRDLSMKMSKTQSKSDYMMLALAYGSDSVSVDIFYGSDFFMESQETLNKLFKDSPNPLERRSILIRMAQSKNKFNKEKSLRETILYKLLPYADDRDFKLVMERLDTETIELQTRFVYWINIFEATYGSIVEFWDMENVSEAQKIIMINSLLRQLITSNTNLKDKDGTEKNLTS